MGYNATIPTAQRVLDGLDAALADRSVQSEVV